jgi:hypothetical protein
MNVKFCEKLCTITMLIKTSVTRYGPEGQGFEPRRGKETLYSASPFQNGLGASCTMGTAALSWG